MHSFVDYKCDFSRKLLRFGAVCMVISSASATSVGDSVQVQMQTLGGPVQSNQSARVPEWQTGAGGKMAFEVASIRPSAPGTFTPPNFPLSNDDSYEAVHGVFSADFPLWVYIQFAYKLGPSPDDLKIMLAGVPKWVDTESFTIRARAGGDPTKDQMRLMVQSLLADRFKLAVHFETRVVPVLALTLEGREYGPNCAPTPKVQRATSPFLSQRRDRHRASLRCTRKSAMCKAGIGCQTIRYCMVRGIRPYRCLRKRFR